MVFIRDEGVFDAPIDKIWKLHMDREVHTHDSIVEMVPIEQKGNQIKFKAKTKRPDGKVQDEVWLMTMFQPDGFMNEVLEGPAKGSKNVHTYIPMGNKTKVVVAGDFKLAGMDDEATRKATLAYLDMVFQEDSKHLKEFD